MGIITLALFSAGVIPDVTVPSWVIVVSATALSLGTAVGGWRIMKTMGQRVAKLEPVHGFAAETTAASILFGTAYLGMPVSTTQVISSAIMGVGASQGARRRPLGHRPADPHRLDPDHPGGRHPRRPRLGRRSTRSVSDDRRRAPAARHDPPGGTPMSFRLLPKDPKFFELFAADGDNLAAAAAALKRDGRRTTTGSTSGSARSRRSRSAATRSTTRSTGGSRTPSSRRSTARTSTSWCRGSTTSSTGSSRSPRRS